MQVNRTHVIGATVGIAAFAAFATAADASPPSGFTPTTLAVASLASPVRVHSNGVRLTTLEATDVRVQRVDFVAGGASGWHHHPGLVMVVVASGSVTSYDGDCTGTSYGPGLPAGAAFLENGNERGQVTSAGGATVYATSIAPRSAPPVFRVEDVPPRCASTPGR